MRSKLLAILTVFAVVLSAVADETFPALEANGHLYKNVTVTTVTASDIYFTYDGGMGNARLADLSPELQQRFHYDPDTAAAQEQQQARANANYLADRPAQWGTDLTAALNQARSGNRCVLMDFTGSDWCPWCMKLDQDVFSTPQFAGFANSKLVLVRVDFPHNLRQSEDLRQANAGLASRFNVDSYPTCILLDSSGKELGRQNGYAEGGPQAFIERLERFSPMLAKATSSDTDPGSAATAPATDPDPSAPVAGAIGSALPPWAPKLGRNWGWIAPISAGLAILLTGGVISRKSA